MNKTICFYDFEATSVARTADPISIGIIAVTGKEIKSIYLEFTDFNPDKADDWVKENIISKLTKPNTNFNKLTYLQHFKDSGYTDYISLVLKSWLKQFESIEFWADFMVIDAPMLLDLITEHETMGGHKIGLPIHLPNIKYYDFYDIHTLFKDRGVDSDCSREDYGLANGEGIGYHLNSLKELGLENANKHNALFDAYLNWKCYEKLNKPVMRFNGKGGPIE